MLFLLDTNVISELTKPSPNAALLAALTQHELNCALSAPTIEELAYGCARLRSAARRAWLSRWIDGLVAHMAVLTYDAKAALWLGAERARLAAVGRPVARTDGEIAAIAVAHGLILVTRNVKDFEVFAGLSLQDWYEVK